MSGSGWRIRIDTGGTFTDCLAVAPDGHLRRLKVLSSSTLRAKVEAVAADGRLRLSTAWGTPPGFCRGARFRLLGGADAPGGRGIEVLDLEPDTRLLTLAAEPPEGAAGRACELRFAEEAPVLAARLATGTPAGAPLPPLALRLATTRATNALLERTGARVALFITRGLGDLLVIGTQQRPDLFALDVRRPAPLYETVVEVDERLDAQGRVLVPLDLGPLAAEARRLLDRGIEHAAVALLHSYRNPEHERALVAFLAGHGLTAVGSAELAPLIQILPRAETTVVEAYLAPVMESYLEGVAAAVGDGSLHVMTSAGGLVRESAFRAKDALLSGPAGGVVGAARAGRRSGFDRVISFDMGGTSTDVARFDGDFEYVFEHRVGDARLVAPALALETVAAGGGSICAFDGERLTVGPGSAGARPGPACYGAGGPLTLTDVNLLLGRLDPNRFEIPLDEGAAEARAGELVAAVGSRGGGLGREEILAGLLELADLRMADAIRAISVRRGYDPRGYALVAMGGAGAQHACAVADLLGIPTVLVPPDAGLLSAVGLGAARLERFAERQVLAPLDQIAREMPALLGELERQAVTAVTREEADAGEVAVRRRIVNLRFAGQDATLPVELEGLDPEPGPVVEGAFHDAYRRRYGYLPAGRRVEVESMRVVASSAPAGEDEPVAVPEPVTAAPAGHRRARLRSDFEPVPFFEREALPRGAAHPGPALVVERHSATVVPLGWSFRVDGAGALVVSRSKMER